MTQKSTASLKYNSLDHWRGIASLGVVLYHGADTILFRRGAADSFQKAFLNSFHVGSLGVQLFFVISGFCIVNTAYSSLVRNRTLASYLIARVRRIYPTYWAALFLTILLLLGIGVVMKNDPSQQTFSLPSSPVAYLTNATLTTYLFGQGLLLPVAWTLSYEVAFYLLVALALWIGKLTRQERFFWGFLHGLTFLCLVLLAAFPKSIAYPFDLWPQFGFGILLYDHLARRHRSTVAAASITALAALFLIASHPSQLVGLGQEVRPSYSVALGFAMILLWLYRYDSSLSNARALRWLLWLGTFSYSLYLTHFFVVRIAYRPIERFGLPAAVALTIQALVAIGAAYVFFLIAERPFLKRRESTASAASTRDARSDSGGDTISPDASPTGTPASS